MANKDKLGELFSANNSFNANVNLTFGNSSVNVSINSTSIVLSPNTSLSANGGFGSAGQALTSNGSAVYWSTIVGTNTAAQYTWSNTHSFTNTVTLAAVSANGGLGSAGQFLTSNGTATYWSSAAGGGFTNGQSISVNNFVITGAFTANGSNGSAGQFLTSNGTATYWSTSTSSGSGNLPVRQQYTGDGTTNTFTVTGGYLANQISVYLNGVMLRNGAEINVPGGTTFSFNVAPANGSLIDVIGSSALYSTGVVNYVTQQITANGTSNTFAISGGYGPNQIQVYLNGVKQLSGVDVDISSGSNVTFVSTPANGYVIDVVGSTSVYTLNGSITIGNSSITNNSVIIGNTTQNATITSNSIFLGNSSVNCVINSTSVYVNGIDYNPTTALAIAVALS